MRLISKIFCTENFTIKSEVQANLGRNNFNRHHVPKPPHTGVHVFRVDHFLLFRKHHRLALSPYQLGGRFFNRKCRHSFVVCSVEFGQVLRECHHVINRCILSRFEKNLTTFTSQYLPSVWFNRKISGDLTVHVYRKLTSPGTK